MNLQDFECIPTAHRFKNSYSAVSVLKPASTATSYKFISKHFQFTFLVPYFWREGREGKIQCQTNATSIIHPIPHINVFTKLSKGLF